MIFPLNRALRATYTSIENVSNVEALKEDIAELSERAGEPNLWDDPAAAQVITSKLSHKQTELERLNKLVSRIDDLEVLVELGQDEDDADSMGEPPRNWNRSARRSPTSKWSRCSPASSTSARPVTIRAGAGGWTRRTSPKCCCGCTCAGPNATAT